MRRQIRQAQKDIANFFALIKLAIWKQWNHMIPRTEKLTNLDNIESGLQLEHGHQPHIMAIVTKALDMARRIINIQNHGGLIYRLARYLAVWRDILRKRFYRHKERDLQEYLTATLQGPADSCKLPVFITQMTHQLVQLGRLGDREE